MHTPISVLVIEDEEIWVKSITHSLQEIGAGLAGVVTTEEEAITAFETTEFDVALIDIFLGNKNSGIELATILSTVYGKPFIFVTASLGTHTLKEAADANPSAYLIKPVNTSSLFIAIQNALSRSFANVKDEHEDRMGSFFVKQGNRYKKIYWKDVVYLSAGKNYLALYNAEDETEYYIRSSLQKALQYIIPQKPQRFVQLNRAEAVQLSYIMEIKGDQLKTNYKNFTLTEAYSKEVKKKLNILA